MPDNDDLCEALPRGNLQQTMKTKTSNKTLFNSAEGMGKANFTAEKQIHSEGKIETK